MGPLNKRNALLGWTVWQVGKRVAKKKARSAVPGRVDDSMRPNKSAIAGVVAAAGGALWFWRRRRDGSAVD
jgi:MYXO-CTERM domain-containing protein